MKKSNQESIKLFSALDRLSGQIGRIKGFPKVTVDQTNFRISDIIKRNLAGEQVLGNNNLSFDYESSDKANFDKVNPFSDMGFNLDDVIILAHETSQQVTDLQNRQGELKQKLDQAKQDLVDQQKKPDPVSQPAAPKEAAPDK